MRAPQVENEARVGLPSKKGTSPEQTTTLEESAFKISGQLSSITRHQKYFRTRENRNFATVRSTEKRIINFSLIQCGLIVLMGALQVFIVRFFFQVCGRLSKGLPCLILLYSRSSQFTDMVFWDFRVQGKDMYDLSSFDWW